MSGSARGRRWRNWAGTVDCVPREVVTPRSVQELAQVIGELARGGRHVRVAGSGHSFTPLVRTDDVMLAMTGMQGITDVDEERGLVTVLGGTPLKRLGNDLLAHGLAQENLGDVDVQSITGATSTGTHGTGINYGNISTQIAALTLVTAQGETIECSPDQRPDVFKAAQVSLGALGVVASLTLRVVPAQRMRYQSRRERVDDVLTHLDRYQTDNDHFEFYWFPYTDWTQTKFLNPTEARTTGGSLWGGFNKVVLENGVFGALSTWSRAMPSVAPLVSKISAWGVASTNEVDYSHRLFATLRAVRFVEMEYNIPAAAFTDVLNEIRECVRKQRFAVHFPVECRFVQGDDIWLSPAYQRDSAYIAVHMYKGMPYADYFQAIEEIFTRYDGRPHWGKMHTRDAAYLAAHYPHWDDFRRVRAALDPEGVFLNDYLSALLDADRRVAALAPGRAPDQEQPPSTDH